MWQLLIVFYFIFGAAANLLRRVLAQRLGEHNRLVNAIFFLLFLLPATVILCFFFPHNLNVGKTNLIFLLGGSVIWPIYNLIAFSGNKKVDMGIFAIISNLSPLFTLAIAIPFLRESLSGAQIFGAGLLVLSGVLAAASQFNKSKFNISSGLLTCLISTAVLGVATAYERFMLNRVDFGAYLVYGWGAQIAWSAILAHRELKKLPLLFKKGGGFRGILISWGSASVLQSVAFITALKLSSASLISAASDFMSVAVVISAYYFLKERKHLIYKSLAVAIGLAGLIFIAK